MDKVILVFYVNVDGLEPEDVESYMCNVRERLRDDNTTQYLIPVTNQQTKVECINPKLVSKEEYQGVREVLERQKESYDREINRLRRENRFLNNDSFNFEFK